MHFIIYITACLALTSAKDGPAKSLINFNDPEISYDAQQLIEIKGYPCETHKTTTEDGYILTMHRINAPQGQTPDGTRKQPVFLMHGFEGSSTNYVDQLPYESLGFILADQGFDVWMGNARGNVYSKGHVKLDPRSRAYWAFSWDEMAAYDLPAFVDYVLNMTKYDKLYYVGHSQGTTMMFAKCSLDPEYCEKKIKGFFPMAPVARTANRTSSLNVFGPYATSLNDLFYIIGYTDFLDNNGIVKAMRENLCHDSPDSDAYAVCINVLYLLVGDKMSDKQNTTHLGVLLAHNPAGTSTQNFAHWGQGHYTKKFQKYDHGWLVNWQKYGHVSPPVYEVSNLNIPTYFFRGGKDYTSNEADDAWLASQLKGSTLVCNFFFEDYTHTDFIWSVTAYQDIYPYIINNIHEIEQADKEGRQMNCIISNKL